MKFNEVLKQQLKQASEEIVANNASGGQVAGVTGEPPVFPKRKNKTVLGYVRRIKKFIK